MNKSNSRLLIGLTSAAGGAVAALGLRWALRRRAARINLDQDIQSATRTTTDPIRVSNDLRRVFSGELADLGWADADIVAVYKMGGLPVAAVLTGDFTVTFSLIGGNLSVIGIGNDITANLDFIPSCRLPATLQGAIKHGAAWTDSKATMIAVLDRYSHHIINVPARPEGTARAPE